MQAIILTRKFQAQYVYDSRRSLASRRRRGRRHSQWLRIPRCTGIYSEVHQSTSRYGSEQITMSARVDEQQGKLGIVLIPDKKTTFHTAFQRLVKTFGRDNIVTHLPRLLMCDIRESTSFQCVTSPFSASSMARSSSDFLPARLGCLTMDTPSSALNTFLRLGRIAGFSIFNISWAMVV